jgi:hypothetical protein
MNKFFPLCLIGCPLYKDMTFLFIYFITNFITGSTRLIVRLNIKYLVFQIIIIVLFSNFFICRSVTLPARKIAGPAHIVFTDLIITEKFFRHGRICLLSHFMLKCKKLTLFEKETGHSLYLRRINAYSMEGSSLSAVPSQGSSRFGLSFNFKKVPAIKINGEILWENISFSQNYEGIIFLSSKIPPGYSKMRNSQKIPKENWEFIKIYYAEMDGNEGQKQIFIDLSGFYGSKKKRKKKFKLDTWILKTGKLDGKNLFSDLKIS